MLRLSRKTLYAIEAVLDIAYQGQDGDRAAGGDAAPVQSADVTRRQGIPRRYLEQALQQMVRAGILTGRRGPKGGYRLARPPADITLGEIVRVVEATGDDKTPAAEEPEADGSALGRGIVRPLWAELRADVMRRLDATAIDDLCNEARRRGIAPDAAAGLVPADAAE